MTSLLFIVAQTAPKQYADLKDMFGDGGTVDVVLDRRHAERRRRQERTDVDRRHSDRRTRDVTREVAKYGCILVRQSAEIRGASPSGIAQSA